MSARDATRGDEKPIALDARGLARRVGRGPQAFMLAVERFSLRAGEITVILGPNGSGKTTLLRVLAGDPRLAGVGEVRLARGRATLVAQRPLAFAGSVAHNAGVGLLGLGLDRAERSMRARGALDRFGLAALAEHDAGTLSGGELRRLALARAFVIEPSVLLLDEPFDDLDGDGQRRLSLDLQQAVRETGIALAVVTHDLSRALLLADRIAVLIAGGIVQEGARDEVLARPATPAVARLVGMSNLATGRARASEGGLAQIEVESGHVLPSTTPFEVGERVWIGIRPEHLKIDVGRGDGRPIGRARIVSLLDDGLVTVVGLALDGRTFTTHLLSGRGLARRLKLGEVVEVRVAPEQVHAARLASGEEV